MSRSSCRTRKTSFESVTADSVCELALSFGWKVEKGAIHYADLRHFSEVLAAGTAAALVPIASITTKSTGDRFVYLKPQIQKDESKEEKEIHPGPVCVKLLTTLQGVQRGVLEDSWGWCSPVVGFSSSSAASGAGDAEGGAGESVGQLP
ncbi:hypothetical protein AAFC00_003611 [Neodothiora populina]|uniref:Uncharacterized protein n=1 Tax=Neodothiora populina TaxID=2781224 RepID=A0ABR3PEU6_9PEZI